MHIYKGKRTNKKKSIQNISISSQLYIYVGSFVFGIEIIFKKDIYG